MSNDLSQPTNDKLCVSVLEDLLIRINVLRKSLILDNQLSQDLLIILIHLDLIGNISALYNLKVATLPGSDFKTTSRIKTLKSNNNS